MCLDNLWLMTRCTYRTTTTTGDANAKVRIKKNPRRIGIIVNAGTGAGQFMSLDRAGSLGDNVTFMAVASSLYYNSAYWYNTIGPAIMDDFNIHTNAAGQSVTYMEILLTEDLDKLIQEYDKMRGKVK